jgi:hypothetical protein
VYGGAFPVLNRIPALRRLGVTGLPILRVPAGRPALTAALPRRVDVDRDEFTSVEQQ